MNKQRCGHEKLQAADSAIVVPATCGSQSDKGGIAGGNEAVSDASPAWIMPKKVNGHFAATTKGHRLAMAG
jgi:hypothetical protein